MAIIGHFDYTRKWTDPDQFPTYEASEEQVRADMQALFDEISTYLNGTLINWVEEQISGAIIGQIPDRSLTNLKLVLATITGDEIASKTIKLGNMDDDSVDTDQLVDDAVTEDKIDDDAVTEDKIKDDAVTENKIDDDAVTENKIKDEAVTENKIKDDAVTEDKIKDEAVTEDKIKDDAVTEDKIKDEAVTEDKIKDEAVTENKIKDDAVTEDKIKDGSVTDLKLANAKADLDANSKVKAEQASSSINTITASATLALTDAGKFIKINSSSAVTVTVPLNSSVAFPVGTEIEFCRYGSGAVTFAGASGVTIVSLDSEKTISDRYCTAALKKLDTDTWLLTGSLG